MHTPPVPRPSTHPTSNYGDASVTFSRRFYEDCSSVMSYEPVVTFALPFASKVLCPFLAAFPQNKKKKFSDTLVTLHIQYVTHSNKLIHKTVIFFSDLLMSNLFQLQALISFHLIIININIKLKTPCLVSIIRCLFRFISIKIFWRLMIDFVVVGHICVF